MFWKSNKNLFAGLLFSCIFCAFNLYNYRNVKRNISYENLSEFHKSDAIIEYLESHTTYTVSDEKRKNISSNCSLRELTLFETKRPLTGLVSFPGSGNTWLRYLIQQMTGIGTASMYCDAELKTKGFPYECEIQKELAVVVKTHKGADIHRFHRVVVLIRNPYDALLSFANFVNAGHTGLVSDSAIIETFNSYFDKWLNWYRNLYHAVINRSINKDQVHIIQYEKLKIDMAEELRSLATFLDVNVTDSDINCAIMTQTVNFKRRSTTAEHMERLHTVYNKENMSQLRETALTVEQALKEAYTVDIDLGL